MSNVSIQYAIYSPSTRLYHSKIHDKAGVIFRDIGTVRLYKTLGGTVEGLGYIRKTYPDAIPVKMEVRQVGSAEADADQMKQEALDSLKERFDELNVEAEKDIEAMPKKDWLEWKKLRRIMKDEGYV